MDDKNASQLHKESIIVDGLNASYFLDERVLQRLHQGGVTAVNATIAAWHTLSETMDLIADCLHLFQQHADLIMPVRSLADIETAKATNRVGLILGFQGTDPIHDNSRLLAVYHALGVRIMQLTYNHQNLVGCGCMVAEDEGLTEFGREVIAEMNAEHKGIQWVHSYATQDVMFCIYIVDNEALIYEHSERSGFPANIVRKVTTVVDPVTAEGT